MTHRDKAEPFDPKTISEIPDNSATSLAAPTGRTDTQTQRSSALLPREPRGTPRPSWNGAPEGLRAGPQIRRFPMCFAETAVNFRNLSKLHALVGLGILMASAAVPVGCSNDSFTGCDASRGCKNNENGGSGGTGGEADAGSKGEAGGGMDTGGASGSAMGGQSGSSGSTAGGEGGEGATGGRTGTGGEGVQGGEGGTPDLPDTTPPRVVSVSPADDASGVVADANLVVTFSEPMDRVTTQAAYQSADILPSTVTFSWNATSTVLTINPVSDLEYAEVLDPRLPARLYSASITTTAEDESGNRLARDFEWSFGTMRRVSQLLSVPVANVFEVYSSLGSRTGCQTASTTYAGDNIDNTGVFMFVSVDIRALPEGIAQWEGATLSGVQSYAVDAPYLLGSLRAYHLSVFPPESVTWATPVLRPLGAFSSNDSVGARSVNVLPALADDYSQRVARNQLSQYRLSFDDMTDGNSNVDLATFTCGGFYLTARYVIP